MNQEAVSVLVVVPRSEDGCKQRLPQLCSMHWLCRTKKNVSDLEYFGLTNGRRRYERRRIDCEWRQ